MSKKDLREGFCVRPLNNEELEMCRACIGLDMTDAEKDELIRIVDHIVSSFVDQAFGIHPAQLSLAARANRAFQGFGDHGNLALFQETRDVDLDTEGASNPTKGPEGQVSP